MRHRTTLAVLIGATTLVAVAHYAYFRVLGPPARWGTSVVVKVPTLADRSPAQLGSHLTLANEKADSEVTLPIPASIAGTPFYRDAAAHCDLEVLQTHSGPLWGDGQRFYTRRASEWTESRSASRIVAAQSAVACPGGRPSVFLVRWDPWFPYRESYGRFLQSTFDRPRRSEWGIYRLNVKDDSIRFLFPGYGMASSPDRRYIAYLTSTNGSSGFHNVIVYDIEHDRSLRVLSLWEADPGSGPSFSYRWSSDSKALVISGRSRGWSFLADDLTDLYLAFYPGMDQLFNLNDRKANSGLNPPASRVTALTGQAPRSADGGLGVP